MKSVHGASLWAGEISVTNTPWSSAKGSLLMGPDSGLQ